MPKTQHQEGTGNSTFCVVIRTFLSSFWHTDSSFVKRNGCLQVRQDKGGTYQFTESALRGEEEVASGILCHNWLWYDKPVLWCGQGIGMESLRRCTWPVGAPWRRKPNQCWWPLFANSTIQEHKRWKSTRKELPRFANPRCPDSPHKALENYQTMVLNIALDPCPFLPKPEDSGWYTVPQWRPSEAKVVVAAACLQLTYCERSRGGECCVNRRCTCDQQSLRCSETCKCGDRCRNDRNTAAEANEAWL